MTITIENILLIGSILLFFSIIAGQSSYRFGVPTLVLFLATGMLAGADGIGQIYFNNPTVARFIGVVALNFILFSGGFDTKWQGIKPIVGQGIVLSSLGVILTTILVGLFTVWVTDFSIYEGLLLGAIVSSTDAAAVFSILRSNNMHLKYHLRPTLELESGSNDPMAYLLTIAFLGLVIDPEMPVSEVVMNFLKQISLGIVMGFLLGKITTLAVNKIRLGYDGLYPVLVMTLMLFTYSATDYFGGNGFLAVYLSAVYLGNRKILKRKSIASFFDGFAWLMQIILFLTLGLLVFPSQMLPIIGVGMLISVFIIFVARPISVFLSLAFFKVNVRSRLFTSWVGLRGAVPIVFATYPLIAGIDKAGMIFNIVFFISLTSIVLQGTTLPFVARWLRVLDKDVVPAKKQLDIEVDAASELIELELLDNMDSVGKTIQEIDFPDTARITMIKRSGNHIVPNGLTELLAKDRLVILCQNRADVEYVKLVLCVTR